MNQATQPPISPTYYLPVRYEAAIAGKSSKILLFMHESRTRIMDGTVMIAQGINDGLNLWCNGLDSPDKIHYNGTTASYADGHAKWYSSNELQRQKYAANWRVNGSTYPTPVGLPAGKTWPRSGS